MVVACRALAFWASAQPEERRFAHKRKSGHDERDATCGGIDRSPNKQTRTFRRASRIEALERPVVDFAAAFPGLSSGIA